MKRAYVYPKKNLSLYFIGAMVLLLIFQINIFSRGIKIDYQQRIEEIKTISFVKSLFCINNSLEYICMSRDSDLLGVPSSTSYFSHFTFPIIDYLISDSETSVLASETYPILTEKEAGQNVLEVFSQDAINAVDPVAIIEPPQAESFVVNTGSYSLDQLTNFNFLINNIYNVDPSVLPSQEDFDVNYFMSYDAGVDLTGDEPKILIYHTHSQESFVDSEDGEKSDTVVGVGDELTTILEDEYGISVYHLRDEFDIVDGVLDRSKAYELIEVRLEEILEEYPSIEVLIDVHRDGIPDDIRLVTTIDEEAVAKIMFFNGLCKTLKDGTMQPLQNLTNPYVKENMAFSFQMFLKANELYPSITRKIYVRDLRYNLHLRPKSMLIEVGAQTNTVEEATNAMAPLAEILYQVISE